MQMQEEYSSYGGYAWHEPSYVQTFSHFLIVSKIEFVL
jgi:hypothetical protein